MEEEEVSKTLDTLSARIDELSEAIRESKEKTREKIKEEIDILTNQLSRKKESAEAKIKEEPITYVMGAFIGGLIVGYMMSRGKK